MEINEKILRVKNLFMRCLCFHSLQIEMDYTNLFYNANIIIESSEATKYFLHCYKIEFFFITEHMLDPALFDNFKFSILNNHAIYQKPLIMLSEPKTRALELAFEDMDIYEI